MKKNFKIVLISLIGIHFYILSIILIFPFYTINSFSSEENNSKVLTFSRSSFNEVFYKELIENWNTILKDNHFIDSASVDKETHDTIITLKEIVRYINFFWPISRDPNLKYKQSIISVCDNFGEVRSIAFLKDQYDYLELDYLITSPLNFKPNIRIKGSGQALVLEVIKESVKKGYEGVIKLYSHSNVKTINFYHKIGFISDTTVPKVYGVENFPLVLSKEKAKEILHSHEY